MLLPGGGGTESRSLESSGKGRKGGGMNPLLLGGSGASPGKFFKIYVSENAFQAILKPIFPYSINSILSKVRHSNTLFFAINFSFPCHPLSAKIYVSEDAIQAILKPIFSSTARSAKELL